MLDVYVTIVPEGYQSYLLFYIPIAVCLAAGLITLIYWRSYGMAMLGMTFGNFFIFLMILEQMIGLPRIMEGYRVLCFLIPAICIQLAMAVDAIISLAIGWLGHFKYTRWLPHTAALAAAAFGAYLMVNYEQIRDFDYYEKYTSAYQLNGAIASTLSILDTNENYTYTILSTNDELRMMDLYGYHYEEIILLHRLENVDENVQRNENFNVYGSGADDLEDPNIYIPTRYVYIYVEKKVPTENVRVGNQTMFSMDYTKTSKAGAAYELPISIYSDAYQGYDRWVVMSRMAEWVKTLRIYYPEAVTVFYEDEDFACYRLSQGDIPYNLGLYYGYNQADRPHTW